IRGVISGLLCDQLHARVRICPLAYNPAFGYESHDEKTARQTASYYGGFAVDANRAKCSSGRISTVISPRKLSRRAQVASELRATSSTFDATPAASASASGPSCART